MKTFFCRVDDRLLHGQLTAAWVRALSLTNIFVVDDELASDKMAARVLTMMAPQKVRITVMSIEQAAYLVSGDRPELEDKRLMCLFRDLKTAAMLIEKTNGIFQTLTLGGMSYRVDRNEIGKSLFLSNEERKILRQIVEEYGVSVFQQILPSDSATDVWALLKDGRLKER